MHFRLRKFKTGEAVRRLHARYGSLHSFSLGLSPHGIMLALQRHDATPYLPLLRARFPEERDPSTLLQRLLWQLFPDGHDRFQPDRLVQWVHRRFPDESVRLPLLAFRGGAFYYYIEAAAERVEGRSRQPWLRRQLQRWGGRLARLRGRADRQAEQQALGAESKTAKAELRLGPQWPFTAVLQKSAQLWWHYAMTLADQCLLQGKTRVSRQDRQLLCQWLSIPEIGLSCTPATIKAARRRFADRNWFGERYLTYLCRPRIGPSSGEEREVDDQQPNPNDSSQPIGFTCLRCTVTHRGTLRDLGAHLQDVHGIVVNTVEVSTSHNRVLCRETGALLATFDEQEP